MLSRHARALLGAAGLLWGTMALGPVPVLWAEGEVPEVGQAENEVTPTRDRTYLVEMAMTLEGVRRLVLWVETHAGDTELARYAYPVAERYVEVSSHLTPSKRLSGAHPHLLLIVENVERAMDSAARGDLASFRQRTRTVREELAILEAMLKQLKLKLPELMR